jgi:hypothetical protein
LDNFWSHPEWGSHKCVFLGHCCRDLTWNTLILLNTRFKKVGTKSASFTSPVLVNKIFAARRNKLEYLLYRMSYLPLISRWSLLQECKYSSPFKTSRSIMAIKISSNGPGFIWWIIEKEFGINLPNPSSFLHHKAPW